MLEAARTFADALPAVPSNLPKVPGIVALPNIEMTVTSYGFDLAAELLAAQKDFAGQPGEARSLRPRADRVIIVAERPHSNGRTSMPEDSAGNNLLGAFIRAQRQMANLLAA